MNDMRCAGEVTAQSEATNHEEACWMLESELQQALPAGQGAGLKSSCEHYHRLTQRRVVLRRSGRGPVKHLVVPSLWQDLVRTAQLAAQLRLPFKLLLELREKHAAQTEAFLSRDLTPLQGNLQPDPWTLQTLTLQQVKAMLPSRPCWIQVPPLFGTYTQYHTVPGERQDQKRTGPWQVYPPAWADYVGFCQLVEPVHLRPYAQTLLRVRSDNALRRSLYDFVQAGPVGDPAAPWRSVPRYDAAPPAEQEEVVEGTVSTRMPCPSADLALDVQRTQVRELELGVAALGRALQPRGPRLREAAQSKRQEKQPDPIKPPPPESCRSWPAIPWAQWCARWCPGRPPPPSPACP